MRIPFFGTCAIGALLAGIGTFRALAPRHDRAAPHLALVEVEAPALWRALPIAAVAAEASEVRDKDSIDHRAALGRFFVHRPSIRYYDRNTFIDIPEWTINDPELPGYLETAASPCRWPPDTLRHDPVSDTWIATRVGVDAPCLAFRRGEVLEPQGADDDARARFLAATAAGAATLAVFLAVAALERAATRRAEKGNRSS